MPCSDGQDSQTEARELFRENSYLTQMLCWCLENPKLLAQRGVVGNDVVPVSIQLWWVKHQREDADRREAELRQSEANKKRAAALSKLSEEERLLLGLRQ